MILANDCYARDFFVMRIILQVDLFRLHLLLVPVHLGMHWCLAAVNFRSGVRLDIIEL